MKLTQSQLRRIIKEEVAKALNEQGGTFTYSVFEDPPRGVEIKGIDGVTIDGKFEKMMQDLEGKSIDFDDGDGPFQFSIDLFGSLDELILSGQAPTYVEMWAKMKGYEAERSGAYY